MARPGLRREGSSPHGVATHTAALCTDSAVSIFNAEAYLVSVRMASVVGKPRTAGAKLARRATAHRVSPDGNAVRDSHRHLAAAHRAWTNVCLPSPGS